MSEVVFYFFLLPTVTDDIFFFFFNIFFGPQVEVPPSTLRFTVLHNDPAAPQDHCGRRRIRTRDLCPRSLVHYQLSHHISKLNCVQTITILYINTVYKIFGYIHRYLTHFLGGTCKGRFLNFFIF